MADRNFRLEVDTSKLTDNWCDGCGKVIAKGETIVTGIESCCGQCLRTLCLLCIADIQALVAQRQG